MGSHESDRADMQCIRLLHPDKFDKRRKKFIKSAFRNSKDDGCLSVIGVECIDGSGASICQHLSTFWRGAAGTGIPGVVGVPPIFWKFESALLPSHQVAHEPGVAGDCHHNIKGVPDDVLVQVFANTDISDYSICMNGEFRPIKSAEEIIALQTPHE